MKKKKTKPVKSNKGKKKNFFRWFLYIAIVFFGSSVFFTVLYRFVNPPITPLMIIRYFEKRSDGNKSYIKKEWKNIEYISPYLVTAVVCSEDNKFLSHFGFDFQAIEKVSEQNKKGKRIKGASTISQQTAKNVFLWPARSWIRKGLETYFTLLIEVFWSKERIMEVYLNVIEMGEGVYGAEAASSYYFNTSSKKLSRSQAAYISAILPNPRRWSASKPTSYIEKKHNWILNRMGKIGKVVF